MKIFRILAFNALTVFFNVHVSASALCDTVEDVRRSVEAWHPPGTVTEMGHDATKAFLDDFNARPPVSKFTGESMAVVDQQDSPFIILVTFEKSCAVVTMAVKRGLFMSIFNGPKEKTSI